MTNELNNVILYLSFDKNKGPHRMRPLFGLLCCILFITLFPASAHANKMFVEYRPIEFGVGYEDLHLFGSRHNSNNHGLMFSFSGGFSLLVTGLQIEQDLGYIDFNYKANDTDGKHSEKLFKGATFLGLHMRLPTGRIWTPDGPVLTPTVKLGIGSVYMQPPKDIDKAIQAWFAIRAAIGTCLTWIYDSGIGIGAEFDYTLGLSTPNVFDHRRATHFIGAKLVLLWMNEKEYY